MWLLRAPGNILECGVFFFSTQTWINSFAAAPRFLNSTPVHSHNISLDLSPQKNKKITAGYLGDVCRNVKNLCEIYGNTPGIYLSQSRSNFRGAFQNTPGSFRVYIGIKEVLRILRTYVGENSSAFIKFFNHINQKITRVFWEKPRVFQGNCRNISGIFQNTFCVSPESLAADSHGKNEKRQNSNYWKYSGNSPGILQEHSKNPLLAFWGYCRQSCGTCKKSLAWISSTLSQPSLGTPGPSL